VKVLWIPCYVDGLPRTSASVRLRAEWPARYLEGAEVYPNVSRGLGEYDAYVFQKAYLGDWAQWRIEELREMGKVLALDMCDADWLDVEHERRLLRVIHHFDFAVCPTEGLAEWLRGWLPTRVIPDRLDLEETRRFPEELPEREPGGGPRVVWFGYSHNWPLMGCWPEVRCLLDELDLELGVVSDKLPAEVVGDSWGDGKGPHFYRWSLERANWWIAQHDIALCMSRSPYKSHNRALTAAALGVAPAVSFEQFERLLDEDFRAVFIEEARKTVAEDHDVRISALRWGELMAEFRERQEDAAEKFVLVNQEKRGG
jgi:hypothetical protein